MTTHWRRNIALALVVAGLAGTGGCAQAAYSAGGGAAGVLATFLLMRRPKCGDLQELVTRNASVNWATPAMIQQASFALSISEAPLVDDLKADDVQIWNAQSIICKMLEQGGDLTIASHLLELAYAKRMTFEAVVQQADSGTANHLTAAQQIARALERSQGTKEQKDAAVSMLASFADSVRQASQRDPVASWRNSIVLQQRVTQLLSTLVVNQSLFSTDRAYSILLMQVTNLQTSGRQPADSAMLDMSRLLGARLVHLDSLVDSLTSRVDDVKRQTMGLAFFTVVDQLSVRFPLNGDGTSRSVAKCIAEWAQPYSAPAYSFSLTGFADSRGASGYNLDLSQRRAQQVERVLIQRAHVPPVRLVRRGVGQPLPDAFLPTYPDSAFRQVVVTAHGVATPASRAKNRATGFTAVCGPSPL